MKITILGCGASGGVPLVGCDCPVCMSANPKNKRMRASLLIENNGDKVLVDVSPDLRNQCLRHDLRTVDSIIITHGHADHCHGIDDTRPFCYHKNDSVPLFADKETLERLERSFPYVFTPHDRAKPWYKSELIPVEVDTASYATFKASPHVEIQPFQQWHGKMTTLGLKIGRFAYSTDVNNLPEESLQLIENIDIWIVDCLRYHVAPSHAHLEMTLGWIERVKPKRAILTHMNHDMGYEELKAVLPVGVEPGYDGMVIEL